jgi:hypothetical protein
MNRVQSPLLDSALFWNVSEEKSLKTTTIKKNIKMHDLC